MMKKYLIPTVLSLVFVLSPMIFLFNDKAEAQVVIDGDERAKLEAELAELQKEIAQKEAVLKEQQGKTGSLKKDVSILSAQIDSAKLKIKQKTLAIGNLTKDISAKGKAINDLQSEIEREHDSIAQLIKKTNEIDRKGTAYVVLSPDSITDFYKDLDDFLAVKQSLYASVNRVKKIKELTEDQKDQLQDKKSQEEDAKNAIDSQKKLVEKSEAEKKQLLQLSQSKEKEYQAVLAERQKRVTDIKNKLFSFAGGNKAIPFQEAYTLATAASEKTGVRTAFILAILTQESNLGKNVGTCNRAGDPPSKSWLNIMKPTRDIEPFRRITAALGLDPNITPVSCPIAGGGYGGAMGPAQFIPSTWEVVANRVGALLGVSVPNPWIPRDAIMASALYLKDRGAVGGESAERNAACKYYSGRSCDGKKPYNSFYGNSVMSISRTIQSDIDYLIQYGVSRRE